MEPPSALGITLLVAGSLGVWGEQPGSTQGGQGGSRLLANMGAINN